MNWIPNVKRKPQLPSSQGEPHRGLPDSTFNEGLCPYCGNQSAFQVGASLGLVGIRVIAGREEQVDWYDRAIVLYCRHCEKGVLVIEEQYIGDNPAREGVKGGGEVYYRGKHWWPSPELRDLKGVPPEITDTLSEAIACRYALCYRASVVMSRRTLEAICLAMGATANTLQGKLLELENSGKLHPTLAQWCHEVRTTGNGGAHFDPAMQVDAKDAIELIEFIRQLLRYLYELPQELQSRKGTIA